MFIYVYRGTEIASPRPRQGRAKAKPRPRQGRGKAAPRPRQGRAKVLHGKNGLPTPPKGAPERILELLDANLAALAPILQPWRRFCTIVWSTVNCRFLTEI